MKTITITEKEFNKAKIKNKLIYKSTDDKEYAHSFSPSGMLIDELAYCAGQWTSEDLYCNNCEYEPNEPYNFNYENDLFENTKTVKDYQKIIKDLNISIGIRSAKTGKLQMGAYIALEHAEKWQELLEAYTKKLKEDRTEGISKKYNDELQKEIDEYSDDQYREWLYGDRRDYAGVIYEIAKYFTDERDGSYTKYDHKTKTDASYTFILNDDDIEKAKDEGYNKNQLKKWLIDNIIESGKAREYKEKQENEKRKTERERLAIYKKEQKEKEDQERKEKLLSMKL